MWTPPPSTTRALVAILSDSPLMLPFVFIWLEAKMSDALKDWNDPVPPVSVATVADPKSAVPDTVRSVTCRFLA